MTSGAPWSVKGIDPKAREIAKDLARRSGMTLGEWLNQMILDDGAAPAPLSASAPESLRPVEPATSHPLTAAPTPLHRRANCTAFSKAWICLRRG